VLQPSGKTTRVRRIQSHGRDVETSAPGTRTALNLADLDAQEDVHRGDVVTLAGLGEASRLLDVMLEISPRATRAIKDGLRVRAHHGSGNVAAHVALLTGKELAPGASALAQLRLEAPAFVFLGDRFTLRDWSEQHTLAGGVVLDPDASRRALRTRLRREWLERAAASIDDVDRIVAAYVGRDGAIRRSQLLQKSRFSAREIGDAAARLVRGGALMPVGDDFADVHAWGELVHRAEEAIDADHRAHAEHLGLPVADLRGLLADDLPFPDLFDPLIASLGERGFVRTGSVVRRAAHRAALPEALQAAGAKLTRTLTEKPLEPPSRKELAPDAPSQRALRFLIESGEAVEISAELVMSTAAVSEATETIRAFIRAHGPATVSELRQALGTSRRIVVPLLEYMDRTFVTLRQGDKRALRR
jgi:selenocysteine-specific elongation factor